MTGRLARRLAVAWGIVAIVAVGLAPRAARAITANPKPVEVTQPDGERVRLHVAGDEHANWFEDLDGHAVAQAENGEYRYAVRDARGALVASRYRVGSVTPEAMGIARGLHPALETRTPSGPSRPSVSLAPPTPPNGTVRNLVMLVQFSDHGAGMIRNVSDYATLFNQAGGDPTLAPTGSVHDVWNRNSYGTLDLASSFAGWVPLPNPENYYANNNQGKTPAFRDSMVVQALRALDASVNFAQYDTNNDGYVDAIDVIHSGYGSEVNKNPKRIWSQQWVLANDWVSNDKNANNVNVKVQRVHTEPALWDTTGNGIVHIGVIAHETGHFFGLPDLYDYDYDGQGVGAWCLMGDAWGWDGTQYYPPMLSAWCKLQLGYIHPSTLFTPTSWNLQQAETSSDAVKITLGYGIGEYLLIENREPVGFDQQIPQGGLAVWHVDEAVPHQPGDPFNQYQGYPGQPGWPGNDYHYGVALLQADGHYDLEKLDWANHSPHGDAGDLYRSTGPIALSEGTTPSTDAYQINAVQPTANELGNVSAPGATMSFHYRPAKWVDLAYGGFQFGSFTAPYSSIGAALAGTMDDTVIISKGGTHSGLPPFNRVMSFKSWGGVSTILP